MKNEIFDSFILKLKESIRQMIVERNSLSGGSNAQASEIWSEGLDVFKYLMDLSPESLRSVRYHTSLITGDSILNYWHISHDPMTFAKTSGYAFYTAQVPSNYHLSEPFNVHVYPKSK